MPIRVLIVDDHKLFRQGLISLMRTREDLVEVIGEASSAAEALQITEALQPDVVLMDVYMPEGDGIQATRDIKARFPNVAVVILTSSEHDEHLFEAVRAEASGYLLKDLDANELFEMLQGVSQGEAAMTRAMASRVLKGVAKRANEDPEEELTERELAVLELVAGGASNPQIAEELVISVNTVKTHLRNILDKLQLENRTQAATYAIRNGLVSTQNDTQL